MWNAITSKSPGLPGVPLRSAVRKVPAAACSLFVLPQPVGGERVHGRVGGDRRPAGNRETPDAGHHAEILPHVLFPHYPDAGENQRLLPEEPGAKM